MNENHDEKGRFSSGGGGGSHNHASKLGVGQKALNRVNALIAQHGPLTAKDFTRTPMRQGQPGPSRKK